jgi:pilus assembly protein CpaB
MKAARIVVLLIAVLAGGVAALLAGRSNKPAAPLQVAAPTNVETVDVLVAKSEIAMGQTVKAEDLGWQVWPREAASAHFVRRSDKPNAVENLAGSIARTPFVVGEPIREAKLIKGNNAGFLAAMLPAGKRAISTEISPETGAGGFILPNDRVDVILTRRDREAEKRGRVDVHVSEVILSDVRVLAIDQTVQEKDGQKVVVGKTATLELGPRQAETLALSRQLGTLTLALRSLADANRQTPEDDDAEGSNRRAKEMNMVRYGVTTTASPR